MIISKLLTRSLALALGLCFGLQAGANEAEIRKNLAERVPRLPKIDEVRPGPIPGLFELTLGNDVMYTDAKGQFLIQGDIHDTVNRRNLTQERIDKLSGIEFSALPLKDAIVWKVGNGKRKLAVFADPNCGYCKRFERDIQSLKDVTVYTFLIPILGGDSPEKSKAVWCAKDNTSTWRNWMISASPLPATPAKCDTQAIDRNLAMARKFNVTGTPAIFFEDGSRQAGAMPADDVERRLAAVKP